MRSGVGLGAVDVRSSRGQEAPRSVAALANRSSSREKPGLAPGSGYGGLRGARHALPTTGAGPDHQSRHALGQPASRSLGEARPGVDQPRDREHSGLSSGRPTSRLENQVDSLSRLLADPVTRTAPSNSRGSSNASSYGGLQSGSHQSRAAKDLDFDDEALRLFERRDAGGGPPQASFSRGPALRTQNSKMSDINSLMERLNLDASTVSGDQWSALDALWRHPKSGGVFYVGNQVAASSLPVLEKNRITHVVNCTDSMPLYHENNARASITYLRFDISAHYRRVTNEEQAVRFVQPMLDFVGAALADGKNVMAHCLAGAHRAGTTGVLCLMHFAQLSVAEAVPIAKRLRPIIDPIGGFPQLLAHVERGWENQRVKGAR